MKHIILLALLFINYSCNSQGGGASATGQACSPKELFSVWTSEDVTIDLTGADFAQYVPVKYGDGACSNGRGDFLLYVEHDGHLELRDCANSYTIDNATWTNSCGVLTVRYQSGPVEIFR